MARLASALFVVLMVGCKPDLIPVDPHIGSTTFCGPEGAAGVSNRGSSDAPASSTTVSFTGSPTPVTVTQATPPLVAGNYVKLVFSRPAGVLVYLELPFAVSTSPSIPGTRSRRGLRPTTRPSGNCVP